MLKKNYNKNINVKKKNYNKIFLERQLNSILKVVIFWKNGRIKNASFQVSRQSLVA
jgi:hypothetical protein